VKAGHPDEATIYFKDALRNDPNNAPANLGMARVFVQQGRIDEAVGSYHPAIYGVWPGNAASGRIQTHIELIQALGKAGRRPQAQAELVSMLAVMPGDLSVKKQVAPLALEYGLPQPAANLYQILTQRDAQDESAFAGLGEAEYQVADYPAARDALEAALRLNPTDTAVQKRLDAANQILALDPTRRGLSETDRFERSQAVLAEVLDVLDNCTPAALPADLQSRMESARRLAVKGRRPPSYGAAIESNTSEAEQLWMAGTKACGAMPPADAPLSRVMARLMAR
jgi:tetratricopeptide (TPR) repeat protein